MRKWIASHFDEIEGEDVNKRERVFNLTNGRCYYCGCSLDFENFHIDHFIAKTWGGGGNENLVPSCPDCNHAKSNLSIEGFRNKIKSMKSESYTGRMIGKYFHIEDTDIEFFFEKGEQSKWQKEECLPNQL